MLGETGTAPAAMNKGLPFRLDIGALCDLADDKVSVRTEEFHEASAQAADVVGLKLRFEPKRNFMKLLGA